MVSDSMDQGDDLPIKAVLPVGVVEALFTFSATLVIAVRTTQNFLSAHGISIPTIVFFKGTLRLHFVSALISRVLCVLLIEIVLPMQLRTAW